MTTLAKAQYGQQPDHRSVSLSFTQRTVLAERLIQPFHKILVLWALPRETPVMIGSLLVKLQDIPFCLGSYPFVMAGQTLVGPAEVSVDVQVVVRVTAMREGCPARWVFGYLVP